MHGERITKLSLSLFLLIIFAAGVACAATWETSTLLHEVYETNIKNPRLHPASTGGFHATYKPNSMHSMKYRRYLNGVYSTPTNVPITAWAGGGSGICEAGNGDIWVTWENWADDAYGGEQIWAAKSSNGGASWNSYNLTNYYYAPGEGGQAKNPNIAHYGPSNSSTVISCTHKAVAVQLMYGTWNGSSWSAHQEMGINTDNFFASWGVARNPVDGSVYRTYGRKINNIWQICMRRWNGSSWETETVISTHSGGFASRPSIAISKSGWIMVVWDQDAKVWYRLYNPDFGWTPMTMVDDAWNASVTAIANRNEFYVAYTTGTGNNIIRGKRYRASAWEASDLVSPGAPNGYSVDVSVCSSNEGMIIAAWENHATGGPYAYHSKCTNFATVDPTPPTAPASVADDGPRTDSTSSLHFTWTAASDPNSGIERYEYCVGTSPGSFNVRYWSYAGGSSAIEFTANNLGLVPGTTYYISVRAVNNGGQEGPSRTTDGILCDPTTNEIYFGNTYTLSTASGEVDNPMLASAGDGGMHLTYQDKTSSPHRVHYRKLTGSEWSATEYPGNGSPASYFPDVAEDSTGSVRVIFCNPGGRESNDFYECVKPSGGSWSPAYIITSGATMDWYPRLVAGTGSSLVHYVANGDNTTYNVKHSVRTTAGWSSISTIGSGSYNSQRYGIPDVATNSSGDLYAVWTSSTLVRFAKRTSGGWSSAANIAAHSGTFLSYPKIAVGPDGLAHIVYADHNVTPDAAVYYIKQTGPSTWSAPVVIANGFYPAIVIDGQNRPHVVYGKGNGGNLDIYHKYFNGYAWCIEQNLSNNSGTSSNPTFRKDNNGNLNIAWKDNTSGVYRILYRKTEEPPTCGMVKQYADGVILDLKSKIVTAIFSDEGVIYVEEPNRGSGIRVVASGSGLALGDKVSVFGTLATLKPNGTTPSERYIAGATVTKIMSGGQLQPIAMKCKDVGGATIGLVPGVREGNGELGVGPNNIGLLVKIAGKVTKVIGSYIYVDDGSDIQDILDGGTYRTGVMVRCATTPTVSVGNIVSVTGVIQGSIPSGWPSNRRFIRSRATGDLIKIYP